VEQDPRRETTHRYLDGHVPMRIEDVVAAMRQLATMYPPSDEHPPIVTIDVYGLDPENPKKASTVEGTIREIRVEDREHVGDGKEDPERQTIPTIVLEAYQERTYPKEDEA